MERLTPAITPAAGDQNFSIKFSYGVHTASVKGRLIFKQAPSKTSAVH